MSYSHYRQHAPGWGTQNLQFTQPLAPTFQPQPQWGGSDFYNAHAINPNPSVYEHAWGNVRQYTGAPLDIGVGAHEAKHWHKRAYGGLSDLNTLSPEDIGHAAAYEAYRTWISNSSIYEPLSGDMERQREGLVGLAVGEASRLLQFTNRWTDNYAQTAASDAAAATASILFQRKYRDVEEGEYHRSRSRTRRGSVGSYDDPYASDLLAVSSGVGRLRSHSRQRSHSRSPMMYPSPGPTAPMAIPTSNGSHYAMGTPYPNTAQQLPIYGQPSPYSAPSVVGQQYGSMPTTQIYSGSVPMSQSYSVPTVIQVGGARQRSTSMSIPGYTVQPQVQYAMPTQYHHVAAQQPQAIVVGSGHRKHHHHHHHHRSKKSKRSRSTDYPSRY
ncbi:hypothetical protein MIND_00048700 [Mycena indigotica]|uniref:Uncharacterized protein n=1 Tax=Mycena indigotica TaxID=2126181 RepID=A0A8H6TEN9_9AGAR|nr:uncharacterized protein MIND_00048700 [Mycena indigotica]KAF7315341.1 hypothetical protein MIND_00048700 [Mycena indigotica]